MCKNLAIAQLIINKLAAQLNQTHREANLVIDSWENRVTELEKELAQANNRLTTRERTLATTRTAHQQTAYMLKAYIEQAEAKDAQWTLAFAQKANEVDQQREVIYAFETCLEAERKAHAATANDLDQRLKELASIPSVSAMAGLLKRNDKLVEELAAAKEANRMLHVRLTARNATIDAIKAQLE